MAHSGSDGGLQIPTGIGRIIVERAALLQCPVFSTSRFIKLCKDCGLSVDKGRLIRLEQKRLFSPIFRVRKPQGAQIGQFRIPIQSNEENWFLKGLAWDCTAVPRSHEVPDVGDETVEGYYSRFQVAQLLGVLRSLTLEVHLEEYVGVESHEVSGSSNMFSNLPEIARGPVEAQSAAQHSSAIALLCQLVSNRYFPSAAGDRRRITIVEGPVQWDQWIYIDGNHYDWDDEVRNWDPQSAALTFCLTKQRLRHAFESVCQKAAFADPLFRWYPLTQFVSSKQRENLRGAALGGDILRQAALILRALHQDLFSEELPPPEEAVGQVINHVPELAARANVRRHLELVVNQYNLNPQPKLVLLVEGASEVHMIDRLLPAYFGLHAGGLAIEVVDLHGVPNATGGKKDGYGAVLLLVDYLHHHQTLTFIILDNEAKASELKRRASVRKSLFGARSFVTRPEYIQVWKRSLEFDNFSDAELASAMNELAGSIGSFRREQIAGCRSEKNPNAALGNLFAHQCGRDIDKLALADLLVAQMLSSDSPRRLENRPLVKTLRRVVNLAARNPLPVTESIWKSNQQSRIVAKKGASRERPDRR